MAKIKYRVKSPIKQWRENKGWSQDKVATRLGISRSHLANLENGHRPLAGYMVSRIARVLAYKKVS